ncbi:MAG: hypothetical protein ABI811_24455 [Acidobacteriota bacterium]
MRALVFWLALSLRAQSSSPRTSLPGYPDYSASSIANAAANVAGLYAPNTFISIYGVNLAFSTQAITAEDVRDGVLPTSLPGSSVVVLINQRRATMYFTSPQQVNVLIPPSLVAGKAELQLVDSGRAGPAIELTLGATAPALFEQGDGDVIATHGNGPLVTRGAPAQPGEIVVLYATGLGPTTPPAIAHQLVTSAARLVDTGFQVWLNGTPVSPDRILYAGATPGFAGLFQINLKIPNNAAVNPEIQVGTTERRSPAGKVLQIR